jgi:GT2 family glycosyltransferase
MKLPISIILPTYNRIDRLKRVLAALEAQTYARSDFEVVVVSDGSRDGTDDYLRTLQTPLRLTPVFQNNQGVAVARNTGLARAGGEIALFIDDDVVPAPDLIAEHLRLHGEHDAAIVVLGPMLTPPDFKMQPWARWEQAMLNKQYRDILAGRWEPVARQFYTGNTSLLRRHVLDAGGFDPAFRRAEDVELAYRLAQRGLRFVFNPRAVGYHYAERSFASWLAIPYAYGRNDVIFTRDKEQDWLLPTIMYEFWGRHALIRGLTRACLDRPRISQAAIAVLRTAALAGDRLGVEAVSRYGFSGIFNLRHYQGIADELGGAKAFWTAAEVARRLTQPPALPGARSSA